MATKARPRKTEEERQAELDALADQLNSAVESLAGSDKWRSMMTTAALFRQYSFRNQIILWCEAEERGVTITRVAPFGVWSKLGYRIIKGSKGFPIYAPVKTRLRPDEVTKWQSEGKNPFDDHNRPKMVLRGFRIEKVFAIAQVEPGPDAKPLDASTPWVQQEGHGPEGLWDTLVEGIAAAGFELEHRPSVGSDGSAKGWTDYTRRIVWVDSACDEAEQIRIAAHELWGHVAAGHEERDITRAQKETEADSIAFIVLAALGLDISSSTIEYVTNWSEGSAEVLSAAAETVRRVAGDVLAKFDEG